MDQEPQKSNETTDYDQPVAYDVNGQPLYAHPADQPQQQPQEPAPAQAVESTQLVVSDEQTKARHETSMKQYPFLNLSENEYVIGTVRRHPIALAGPFAIGVILLGLLWSLQINYDFFVAQFGLTGAAASPGFLFGPILAFSGLVILGLIVAYYVYDHNRFFLTNECVVQYIQYSLFSKREQTISLGSIEDASFLQSGLLQSILNYGTVRLSTIGDEDTYTFPYVANPKFEIGILSNAVEAFKNGRQVNGN
jgi:uncharacterized membrane protein YdbT with pleckstrin-like domain